MFSAALDGSKLWWLNQFSVIVLTKTPVADSRLLVLLVTGMPSYL